MKRRWLTAALWLSLVAAVPMVLYAQNAGGTGGTGGQSGTNDQTGGTGVGVGGGQTGTSGQNNDRRGRRNRDMSNQNSRMNGGDNGNSGMAANLPDRYSDLGPSFQGDINIVLSESSGLLYPDEEDPFMIDPSPWNYPNAAAGAVDLYHWTDFTHNYLAPGSVTESRLERERVRHGAIMAERRRIRALRAGMGTRTTSGSGGGSSDMGSGGSR